MPADIERIMAVPSDIEAAIKDWQRAYSTRLVSHGYGTPDPAIECDAWLAIGAAIEAHVAEKVADAMRLERGGCTYCPAEPGGPHKMDCQRPGAGLTRIPVEFEP